MNLYKVGTMKTVDKQMFKTIVKDPIYGKRILEALLSQVLQEPVDILEYISSIKNNEYIIVETNNAYISIEINSNDYTTAKRLKNFSLFSSFYSNIAKINKDCIQINLNYGNTYDLNTDAGIRKYYLQSNELEMFIPNISVIEINVENLKRKCCNGIKNEYDYRYVFMFDLDKEELKDHYPKDEIKEEFCKLIMLKNEDFWIDPDEDKAKLINTERKINFSKGLKQGFEQGSDETTINVIKNLLSLKSSIETIAIAVGLSVDDVKNIIKENNLDTTSE